MCVVFWDHPASVIIIMNTHIDRASHGHNGWTDGTGHSIKSEWMEQQPADST